MATHQEIETLLARVALGDRVAFRRLHQEVAGVLLATAARVLQDRSLAEDVVQDVFASLWQQRTPAAADPPARSFAWLCVIVRNRALDQLRRRPREVSIHGEDADGDEVSYDAASDAPGIFEQISAEQDHQLLQTCLQQLEAEPRQALLMAYLDGLTHAELAERLKRPLGTIKAWIRRSLMSLKLCMEPAS